MILLVSDNDRQAQVEIASPLHMDEVCTALNVAHISVYWDLSTTNYKAFVKLLYRTPQSIAERYQDVTGLRDHCLDCDLVVSWVWPCNNRLFLLVDFASDHTLVEYVS